MPQEKAKKYTNEARIQRSLKRKLTSDEKDAIGELIATATEQIDAYTSRGFPDVEASEEGEPVEKVYDGSGHPEIFIDDFTEVTKVETLDSYGELQGEKLAADYQLYPSNGDYYNSIRLRSGRFYKGHANIRVTGKLGSGALPKTIVRVATAMVVRWLVKETTSSAEFESENIEGYSYKRSKPEDVTLGDADPLAKLLNRYRRIDF